MRKCFIHIAGLLTVLLLAVSCAKERIAVQSTSVPIVFLSDEGGQLTKATPLTSLSSFSVMAVTGTAGSSETSIFNSSFTSDGGTTFTGGKYWPSSDRSYKFYASNSALTASASGPSVTVSSASTLDVVCAVNLSPTYLSPVPMTFNHILARVGYCSCSVPDGYTLNSLSVSFTPKTGGTYNLYAGNGRTDGTGWSSLTSGSTTVIATSLGSLADYDIWLIPGSYTISCSYTMTLGTVSRSFVKSGTVTLGAGYKNNISILLDDGYDESVECTVSVSDWTVSSNNILF